MYFNYGKSKQGLLALLLIVSSLLPVKMAWAIAPSITSISPASGRAGSPITITGTGFATSASKNYAIFSGNALQVPTVATAKSLTLTVPDNAQSGPITVISNSVASNPSKANFTVIPEIIGFSPSSLYAGQLLNITGYSFSPTLSNNTVTFSGNVTAVPVSSTTSSLSVIVPMGAQSGPISVSTAGNASQASTNSLTIACSADQIQSMLDSGSTPLNVYNTCGQSTSNLYGRNYGGGIIAYLNPVDGSGLVAAPIDYYYAMWGAYNVKVQGTQSGIGTGKSNTDIILNIAGTPGVGQTYAAYLSKTQNYNNYTDWFLPSIDELTQIVTNLKLVWEVPLKQTGAGCVYQEGHFVPYLVSGYQSSTVPQVKGWADRFESLNYECGMSSQPNVLVRNYPSAVRLARYFSNTSELKITAFSPSQQIVGGSLTITGTGFSPNASQNIVQFSGGAVTIPVSASATKLKVQIPAGAESGAISVFSNGVQSKPSSQSLTIETH